MSVRTPIASITLAVLPVAWQGRVAGQRPYFVPPRTRLTVGLKTYRGAFAR